MIAELIDRARRDKRRAALLVGAAVIVIVVIILIARSTGSAGKQRTLNRSFENLANANSYHTAATLDLKLPTNQSRQQPIVDVTMNVEGDVVKQDGRPVFVGTMRNEARGRGMVLFADGEVRILRDKVAFKLENLPALLNPQGNLVGRWTYVEVPIFATNNPQDVQAGMVSLLQGMEYQEKSSPPGSDEALMRYSRSLSAGHEDGLIQVFRQGISGNRALHVLTRLMRAYDVAAFDVWVDSGEDEVRAIRMVFVQPVEGGTPPEMATLGLTFSDYGKQVVVEEPPVELTVRPEVFGRIFGSGEIEGLQ